MGLIYLGGINGAGKTTIAQEVRTQFPTLRILHGSAALMEQLGISAGDYDSLRKIPRKVKSQAVEEIFRNLAAESRAHDIIVVAHYVTILNGAITPSHRSWYSRCHKLVLVISPPEEILGRIHSDEDSGKRIGRSLFGVQSSTRQEQVIFLERAQRTSEQVMTEAAKSFRLPHFRVENLNGKKIAAVNQLVRII